MMNTIDLENSDVTELNQKLHDVNGTKDKSEWQILNPKGRHNVAVGIDAPLKVKIDGHVGYYCAGMNKHANVTVKGNVGPGVAENMMSGIVHVTGSASQYAGATAHGGLLIIDGDASSRCGISMKGVDILVKGSVGHMSAFMAQSGRLVICGDAGDALGDSLYEAHIYVRGKIASLGADRIEKPIKSKHQKELGKLLKDAGVNDIDVSEFRRYGSARKLYNFDVDNVDVY